MEKFLAQIPWSLLILACLTLVVLFVNTVAFECRRAPSPSLRSLHRTTRGTPQSRALTRPPCDPLGASQYLRTGPLGLAPFTPPHLWEKLQMLSRGELRRGIDIFDLILHGTPWVLLLLKGIYALKR